MDIVSTTAPDQPVTDAASSLVETRSAPAGGPGGGDSAVTLPGVVALGTDRPGRSWYVVPATRPHPSAAA